MNYEERYKEALDLMKDCVPDENGLVHVHPEDIFPELRESEDEKIRKALIRFHKSTIDIDGIKGNEIEAWLEKQGEKKPYGQRKECLDCQFNYTGECKGSCAMKRSEQHTWKPSEEQMKALDAVIDEYDGYPEFDLFVSLKNDLKKL